MAVPEVQLERLLARIDPLATFVHSFATSLGPPVFYREDDVRGFRFSNPDVRHFCLLRACRIVSALYAGVGLARDGFTQEIAVLLRTVVEFCSQVDYVILSRDEDGSLKGKAGKFVADYFADDWTSRRNEDARVKLNQIDVHKAVGARLDEVSQREEGSLPMSKLMSKVYINSSNYVHGRYPESMDLFGGKPGIFHLYGMSNTPKDAENVEVLDTYITTASNSLLGMVQGFTLYDMVASDPSLSAWYVKGVRDP